MKPIRTRRLVVGLVVLTGAGLFFVRPGICQEPARPDSGSGLQVWDVTDSPSYGKTAERFVTDCELYLFGKFVPPQRHPASGDKPGYLIEKTETDVRANGVVYFSLLWSEPPEPMSEETRRLADIGSELMRQLRERVHRHDSGVTRDGKEQLLGETVTFEPQGLEPATVTFREREMLLKYDHIQVTFPYVEPPPMTAEELARMDRVRHDAAFLALVGQLRPGRLVLAGNIYINGYPLADKAKLMEALRQIPQRAVVHHLQWNGEPYYEAMKIGDYFFTHLEIADFINWKGGQESNEGE